MECRPDTINVCWIHKLRALQISYHFNLCSNPKVMSFFLHFTDEVAEALGGLGTSPRFPASQRLSQD